MADPSPIVPPLASDPHDDFLRCQPYLADLSEAVLSKGEGQPRDGLVINVPLLAAIGLRETWFGWAPGYKPLGNYNGRGDGGHGRGLFQIDDRGRFRYLLPPDGTDWPPFDQAQAAITVLTTARQELAEFRDVDKGFGGWPLFELACICRYNAALDSVVRALKLGVNPDLVTTGCDYGSSVLGRRAKLLAEHPDVFSMPGPGAIA